MAPGFRILVAFAGVSRRLQETPYNDRVAECVAAATKLAELAHRAPPAGLGEIDEALFLEHEHRLTGAEGRRARHFYSEQARVRDGVALWRAGDLEAFGRLMNESCRSSITNWESGSAELIAMQEILQATPGVFGSRFSGAGFGGCCVGLVDGHTAESTRDAVATRLSEGPTDLGDGACAFLLDSDDGLRIVLETGDVRLAAE